MARSRKVSRLTGKAVLAIGGLLSGCSGGEERAESPKVRRCESLLGAKNMEAAANATAMAISR